MASNFPTIPESAFQEITEELERRPLGVNLYRDKCGEGRSQAFLLVNKRCQPYDYSRQCWIRPKLLFHVQEFAKKYVDISFTSFTINQNYKCEPHRDKSNFGESFLVAWGNYTGGDLIIHEGDLSGSHNINCRPFKTDFSKVLHSVAPFTGNRYSLVFYKLKATRMPQEPIPKGEAVFEDGVYKFKRGGKVITPKEGLPHPLRGRTKDKPSGPSLPMTDQGFIVRFD